MEKKISVIMGIYNSRSKEILKKALESILKQTYENFELIICDDGSTNECINWAKEICENDTRVKFIKNEKNKGLAFTLNHCLSVASGEYIARMDDDDISHTDRFEKQIKFLGGFLQCQVYHAKTFAKDTQTALKL